MRILKWKGSVMGPEMSLLIDWLEGCVRASGSGRDREAKMRAYHAHFPLFCPPWACPPSQDPMVTIQPPNHTFTRFGVVQKGRQWGSYEFPTIFSQLDTYIISNQSHMASINSIDTSIIKLIIFLTYGSILHPNFVTKNNLRPFFL